MASCLDCKGKSPQLTAWVTAYCSMFLSSNWHFQPVKPAQATSQVELRHCEEALLMSQQDLAASLEAHTASSTSKVNLLDSESALCFVVCASVNVLWLMCAQLSNATCRDQEAKQLHFMLHDLYQTSLMRHVCFSRGVRWDLAWSV